MLGAVESARLTLAEIGDEASRKLAGNVEQLSVQFAGLERLVDEQDSRVRTMISHLSTGLAEVEAQVAALGDAGVVQTEQLGVSVSQLKEALNSISQPLSDSDTGTSRLIERIGQMRTMLGEVNEIANGSLPQNLEIGRASCRERVCQYV